MASTRDAGEHAQIEARAAKLRRMLALERGRLKSLEDARRAALAAAAADPGDGKLERDVVRQGSEIATLRARIDVIGEALAEAEALLAARAAAPGRADLEARGEDVAPLIAQRQERAAAVEAKVAELAAAMDALRANARDIDRCLGHPPGFAMAFGDDVLARRITAYLHTHMPAWNRYVTRDPHHYGATDSLQRAEKRLCGGG